MRDDPLPRMRVHPEHASFEPLNARRVGSPPCREPLDGERSASAGEAGQGLGHPHGEQAGGEVLPQDGPARRAAGGGELDESCQWQGTPVSMLRSFLTV